MSVEGTPSNKGKQKPGSHAKEGNSFKVTTAIVIPLLAIVIPAAVAIYIAKTPGGGSTSSQPGNPPASVAKVSARSSASASASASGSASASRPASAPTSAPPKTGTVPPGVSDYSVAYKVNTLALDNNRCDNHNNYPYAIFWPDKPEITDVADSPPSGAFGIVLFCSANSFGNGLDPNLQYGGKRAALFSGPADFNSCYEETLNHTLHDSIPFRTLRRGMNLCMLNDSQLALVTLDSVSQKEEGLTGTATVWTVLTGN